MLVAVIGVGALLAARVQLRSATRASEVEEARFYAQSGLDIGRLILRTESNWRTARSNGTWIASQAIGAGTFALQAVDPNDGDLSNWPTDPVVLTATGAMGAARQLTQITIAPELVAISSLSAAVAAGGNVTFNAGTFSGMGQTFATNGNFTCSGTCLIDGQIEADGSITGGRYYGSRVSNAADHDLPASTVFDSYIANGTHLSWQATNGKIEDVVLSPSSNPYGGGVNPWGIYLLDCDGRSITVRNCRIAGTLVLLNPKSGSIIDDSVNMAPAIANFPTLLIKGPMTFQMTTTQLAEGSGMNFNPPGTPYQGASNSTTTDKYPSIINGLVYVSGNVQVKDVMNMSGVLIIGGTVDCTGMLAATHGATWQDNPPPGFCTIPSMKVQTGSWKQAVR